MNLKKRPFTPKYFSMYLPRKRTFSYITTIMPKYFNTDIKISNIQSIFKFA